MIGVWKEDGQDSLSIMCNAPTFMDATLDTAAVLPQEKGSSPQLSKVRKGKSGLKVMLSLYEYEVYC